MVRKKAVNNNAAVRMSLGNMLERASPERAAAMTAAFIAGYYGLTPPITAILTAVTPGYVSTKSDADATALARAKEAWEAANEIAEASATQWYRWIASGFSHEIIPDTVSTKKATPTQLAERDMRIARGCMALAEVYIMSQPGVATAVIEAPARMVAAIGEVVPG